MAKMFSLALPFLLFLFQVSWADDADPDTVKNADGDTPVKYVYCLLDKGTCEVTARFDSMDACERHQIITNSYCDWRNRDTEVTCEVRDSPLRGAKFESYCTF